MKRQEISSRTLLVALCATIVPSVPSYAQTLLSDDFSSAASTKTPFNFLEDQYTGPSAWLGRTRRNSESNTQYLTETVGGITTNFARFGHHRLDAFGSSPARFSGSEIKSRNRWYPKDTATIKSTLEYIVRMRVPKVSNLFPAGLVAAFFTYGPSQTAKDDEIDFEFLGTQLTDPVTPKKLWLNMWRQSTQNPQNPLVPAGVDVSQWQTYKISWNADRIVWQVAASGAWQTLRIAYKGESGYPFNAQHVHLNIWAPFNSASASTFAPSGGQFDEAANMSYAPTTNPALNVIHYFDVDKITVSEYTSAVSAAKATSGEASPEHEASVSSVSLVSLEADSTRATVRLVFSGSLNPTEAADVEHYVVAMNGGTRPVLSAEYDEASHSVLLTLPLGSLSAGAQVRTDAYDLLDAAGQKLSDQLSESVLVTAGA